jgi:hypothetical protein
MAIAENEYVQAINEASGLITVAARRLGCSRQAIYDAAKKYNSVAEAIQDNREKIIDLAEGKLYAKINEGDITSIIFLLKTLGKKRGYIERQEVDATITQGRFVLDLVDENDGSKG